MRSVVFYDPEQMRNELWRTLERNLHQGEPVRLGDGAKRKKLGMKKEGKKGRRIVTYLTGNRRTQVNTSHLVNLLHNPFIKINSLKVTTPSAAFSTNSFTDRMERN
jgi:hypothetical protein